jgi:hypothetical protein
MFFQQLLLVSAAFGQRNVTACRNAIEVQNRTLTEACGPKFAFNANSTTINATEAIRFCEDAKCQEEYGKMATVLTSATCNLTNPGEMFSTYRGSATSFQAGLLWRMRQSTNCIKTTEFQEEEPYCIVNSAVKQFYTFNLFNLIPTCDTCLKEFYETWSKMDLQKQIPILAIVDHLGKGLREENCQMLPKLNTTSTKNDATSFAPLFLLSLLFL